MGASYNEILNMMGGQPSDTGLKNNPDQQQPASYNQILNMMGGSNSIPIIRPSPPVAPGSQNPEVYRRAYAAREAQKKVNLMPNPEQPAELYGLPFSASTLPGGGNNFNYDYQKLANDIPTNIENLYKNERLNTFSQPIGTPFDPTNDMTVDQQAQAMRETQNKYQALADKKRADFMAAPAALPKPEVNPDFYAIMQDPQYAPGGDNAPYVKGYGTYITYDGPKPLTTPQRVGEAALSGGGTAISGLTNALVMREKSRQQDMMSLAKLIGKGTNNQDFKNNVEAIENAGGLMDYTMPQISKIPSDIRTWSQNELQKATEDVTGFGKTALEGVSSLANMGVAAGISALTGIPAPVVIGFQSGGNAALDAKAQGKTLDQQLLYGGTTGLAAALIERIGGFGASKAIKEAGGKLATSFLAKLPAAVSQWANTGGAKIVGKIISDVASEGSENILQYGVDVVLQRLILNNDVPFDIKEAINQGLQGGFMGGLFGVGSAALRKLILNEKIKVNWDDPDNKDTEYANIEGLDDNEPNYQNPNVDSADVAGKGERGYTEGAGDGLNKAGIPKTKYDEILKSLPGSRPDPKTYLSKEYIANHLGNFNNGVTKIKYKAPTGFAGPPDGTFVMPSSVADDLIAKANGNISKLEQLLGLDPGSLGKNPVRIDIANPTGLRMPSGNEFGANAQWVPGGYTSGKIPEIIIDSPAPGQYIVRPLT